MHVRTLLTVCVCVCRVFVYVHMCTMYIHSLWICVHVCVCVFSVSQSGSQRLLLLLQQIRHPALFDVSYFLRSTAQIFNNTDTYKHTHTAKHVISTHLRAQTHVLCSQKNASFYIIMRSVVNVPRTIQKAQHSDKTIVCQCVHMYIWCMYVFTYVCCIRGNPL